MIIKDSCINYSFESSRVNIPLLTLDIINKINYVNIYDNCGITLNTTMRLYIVTGYHTVSMCVHACVRVCSHGFTEYCTTKPVLITRPTHSIVG